MKPTDHPRHEIADRVHRVDTAGKRCLWTSFGGVGLGLLGLVPMEKFVGAGPGRLAFGPIFGYPGLCSMLIGIGFVFGIAGTILGAKAKRLARTIEETAGAPDDTESEPSGPEQEHHK